MLCNLHMEDAPKVVSATAERYGKGKNEMSGELQKVLDRKYSR